MGNCTSQTTANKVRSDVINYEPQEDAQRLRTECKILLLGASDVGKTTIAQQLKVTCHGGFTKQELMRYRSLIYKNALDSAQTVVLMVCKMDLVYVCPKNHANAACILDYSINQSVDFVFSSEITNAIYQLWEDPVIPPLMNHGNEFNLMDNAAYFFSNIRRIGSPTYLPTTEDVLRSQQRSTGMTEVKFLMGQTRIRMFDGGGQRSERKKWRYSFANVTCIIFCASLSEYNQTLAEEKDQNRMVESLDLFGAVVNSYWFSGTPIILFLNKIDVFKTKLLKDPLGKYFPEYVGGADANKAAKFIFQKFMGRNHVKRPIYPYLTQATDTANISLVFNVVKETILQKAIEDSGLL